MSEIGRNYPFLIVEDVRRVLDLVTSNRLQRVAFDRKTGKESIVPLIIDIPPMTKLILETAGGDPATLRVDHLVKREAHIRRALRFTHPDDLWENAPGPTGLQPTRKGIDLALWGYSPHPLRLGAWLDAIPAAPGFTSSGP